MRLYKTSGAYQALLLTLGLIFSIPNIVQAIPPAIQVNQPTSTDAEELSIAINPANPEVLAAGANLRYTFRSTDAGESWTQDTMNSNLGVAGDPCVIFDAEGNLYYAHLSYPYNGGSWLDRIVVQKSTDGGMTWNNGVGVGHNPPKDQDKEWLAADRTNSPYRNNIYMAWTEFDHYGSSSSLDSTRILFSRSQDQSTTWSPPIRISDRGGNCIDEDETVEGSVPAVGPAGQVYMAWSGHDQIYFDRSFDGGESFGNDILITEQTGGWDFSVSGVWRCNGMPITACDVSSSPHQGRIYVVFSDQRNGTHNTDVFLCFSDDEGSTWSEPARVNDDSGETHQFLPWLSVDPTTGTVAVVFYDRRNSTDDSTEVTIAVSNDGGESFNNVIVSDAPFVPWSSVFFGDYIGIDSFDGKIYATWMSMNEGVLSVWMAKLDNLSAVDGNLRPTTNLVMKVPSKTSTRRTRISFTTHHDSPVNLSIFDVRGHLVQNLINESRPAGQYTEMWDGKDGSGRNVSSGMYLVNLRSGQDLVTRKVVITN